MLIDLRSSLSGKKGLRGGTHRQVFPMGTQINFNVFFLNCCLKILLDHKIQASKISFEQHLKERMTKIARPDISNPILMTSTLNPNDMDGHLFLDQQPTMLVKNNMGSTPSNKKNEPSNKITFKDLKR